MNETLPQTESTKVEHKLSKLVKDSKISFLLFTTRNVLCGRKDINLNQEWIHADKTTKD